MQCNITEQGAKVRRNIGVGCLVLAAAVAALAWWTAWWWLWVLAGLAAAGGAFSLFESRKKWCAIRAMGIQTRI